jgi:hypothetical protein
MNGVPLWLSGAALAEPPRPGHGQQPLPLVGGEEPLP